MKKVNKRLTGTHFMGKYCKIIHDKGIIHLKTDSNFLFTYTRAMIAENKLDVLFETDDLYHSDLQDDILEIQTFYEQQWRERGLSIKFIKFTCPGERHWVEPDVEIEKDDYRSFGRNARI